MDLTNYTLIPCARCTLRAKLFHVNQLEKDWKCNRCRSISGALHTLISAEPQDNYEVLPLVNSSFTQEKSILECNEILPKEVVHGAGKATDKFKRKRLKIDSNSKKWIGEPSVEDTVSSSTPQAPKASNHIGEVNENKFKKESDHLTNLDKFIPELVWKMVLDKLDKKKDIENCSNASPYFGFLLKSKRENEIVLPKVFRILEQRYSDQKDESYKETNTESIPWQRPTGNLEPHQLTGLWKCRLICKSWNKAIEDIFQGENVELRHEWFTEDEFESNEKATKFVEHFHSTHFNELQSISRKNPFFSQSVRVHIRLDEQENIIMYCSTLLKMFKMYGHYVRKIGFSISGLPSVADRDASVRGLIGFYLKFREMFLYLPNLEYFSIIYLDCSTLPELLQIVEQEISPIEIPKMVRLTSVYAHGIVDPILKEILIRKSHIKFLAIRGMSYVTSGWTSENLVETLELATFNVDFESVKDFKYFENLPLRFRPNKFKLSLLTAHQYIPWSTIFKALEARLDTKVCLDLDLVFSARDFSADERKVFLKDSLTSRLNFSNLENIFIYGGTQYSLDFLLNVRNSLKSIYIGGQKLYENSCVGELDKQTVEYLGFEEKLHESNIWRLFPHLESVTINKNDSSVRYLYRRNKASITRILKWY